MASARWALIGCSHPHSRMHLRTLQLLPEVEAVALWDPDGAAADALAREQPEKVAGATADLDEALSKAAFAMVAVPNNASPDVLTRCAAAGQHILAEKPLAVSAAALQPALEAVHAARVTLGVCFQNRWLPVVTDLRRLMQEGAVGRPLTIEVRMITSQVRFRDPSHWLFRRDVAGGGILSWLGCHYIDLVRYAFGEEIVEVTALTGTLSGEEIDVEDAACFCFRTASGALGTFHAGYLLARSASGYSGASYDTCFGLRGTEGSLRWQPHGTEPVLHVQATAGTLGTAPDRTLTYRLEPSEAYGGKAGEQFVQDFMAAARAGNPPPASGVDGLYVLHVLDAVYESARTGRGVRVPWPPTDTPIRR